MNRDQEVLLPELIGNMTVGELLRELATQLGFDDLEQAMKDPTRRDEIDAAFGYDASETYFDQLKRALATVVLQRTKGALHRMRYEPSFAEEDHSIPEVPAWACPRFQGDIPF